MNKSTYVIVLAIGQILNLFYFKKTENFKEIQSKEGK